MQGVAPFVQKSLKQQYGIESANLSKQSTGLSYPSFFDWPKTIEETLKKHPEISVLAVFLRQRPVGFPRRQTLPQIRFRRMGARIPETRRPHP